MYKLWVRISKKCKISKKKTPAAWGHGDCGQSRMCFLSERIGGKVVNRWTQGCIRRRCSSTACRRREPEETHDTSWINTIIVPSFHRDDQLSHLSVRLTESLSGFCFKFELVLVAGTKTMHGADLQVWSLLMIIAWWHGDDITCHHHCHHRRHQCQCDYLVGTESLAEQVDGRHLFQDFGLFPDWCQVFRTMSIKIVIWSEQRW